MQEKIPTESLVTVHTLVQKIWEKTPTEGVVLYYLSVFEKNQNSIDTKVLLFGKSSTHENDQVWSSGP